jgi:hypothetical protein
VRARVARLTGAHRASVAVGQALRVVQARIVNRAYVCSFFCCIMF